MSWECLESGGACRDSRLQGDNSPNHLPGPSVGCVLQVLKGLGRGGRRSHKRLALWKRQYLSKGGRQTLIRSTLSSLLIYYVSLFVVSNSEAARLEKNTKGFPLRRGSFGQQATSVDIC